MRIPVYNIRISDEAESDLDNSFIWYEIQKYDLGKEFIKSVNDGIRKIKRSPKSFQLIYKNIRRYLIKKFPYSIYYYIDESIEYVSIIAVFHNSRNPAIWKKRK